jgi:hypothetical protein
VPNSAPGSSDIAPPAGQQQKIDVPQGEQEQFVMQQINAGVDHATIAKKLQDIWPLLNDQAKQENLAMRNQLTMIREQEMAKNYESLIKKREQPAPQHGTPMIDPNTKQMVIVHPDGTVTPVEGSTGFVKPGAKPPKSEDALAAAYMNGEVGKYQGMNIDAIDAVHKMHPEFSAEEITQKGEVVKELNKSRTQQYVMKAKISGFENTALDNIKQLREEIKAQRDSGKTDIPAMNTLLRKWKEITGVPYSEGVNLYGQELAAELAKLASSATAAGTGGTLTDREDWKSFFKPDGSFDQMSKSLDSAEKAVNIRAKAADRAIDDTTKQINGMWGQKTSASNATSQDEEAVAWAKANPNDPRAKKIMEHNRGL